MNFLVRYWTYVLFQMIAPSLLGIGEGPSSGENTEAGALGNIGSFATSLGEGDIGAASNFWKSILSGDPAQISRVLGPAISGINKRGQQEKKTLGTFGNRSGGTNAAAQSIDDSTRSGVNSLVSGLTGEAAGSLGSLGSGLLSTGASATEGAFSAQDILHSQNLNKWNDVFKSIASIGAAPFTGGASLTGPTGGGSGGGFRNPFGGGGGGGDTGWNPDWGADPSLSSGGSGGISGFEV